MVDQVMRSALSQRLIKGWRSQETRKMPYTIVFVTRNTHDVSAAHATTAGEALAITEALQNQNGKIRFIRSPQEGEFGVEMLRLLAKEEEEEIRTAPD
jgi:hypothetical protein